MPTRDRDGGEGVGRTLTWVGGSHGDNAGTVGGSPGSSPRGEDGDSVGEIRGVRLPGTGVADIPPGQRYELGAPLGEGAMGVVHAATDRQIGRSIAVKALTEKRAKDADANRRFVQEARIQGQLEHPAMVPVYDLGVGPDGDVFFTMKRVRGETLEEVIDAMRAGDAGTRERWTARTLLNAFSRLCLAVDYAHQQGVLHRDIKPANIIFGRFGEVYLLDWGVAKVWQDPGLGPVSTHASAPRESPAGTPGFMSPEQVSGDPDLRPASDVYGLGAVLFEMLTLHPLHPQSQVEDVLAATLLPADSRPSRRAPDLAIAPELEAICVRAVALDPAQRFPTAGELSTAIEDYLDGQRDDEQRERLASQHADRAREALRLAAEGPEQSLAYRRTALQELGKALALNPEHPGAMQTMVDILHAPSSGTPAEVELELDDLEAQRLRGIARIAVFAYMILFMYVPLMLWTGVRQPGWVITFYVGVDVASGLSYWVARQPRPGPGIAFVVMAVSNLAFATTAMFFGPLLVTPSLLANNSAAFAFHFLDWRRWASIAMGLLAIIAAFGLELTGWLEPAYRFTEHGMVVSSRALDLSSPLPVLVFLATASIAIVVTHAFLLIQLRAQLRMAEATTHTQNWYLRQMLPETQPPAVG